MFSLLRYAKSYRKQVILGPIFKFLEAVFELLLPLLMARLIDQGILQNNPVKIWEITLWMVLLSVVGWLAAITCQYYASIASQGFGTELRNQLMDKIQQLSFYELNQLGTDTLITRMTSDVNQLQLALAMLIRLVVRAPFLSVGSVIMAFYIDWQIGWLFLATLPLFCLILWIIIRGTIPLYKKVQQKIDGLNQRLRQNLSGVRIIRAFTQTEKEIQDFSQANQELAKTNLQVTNLSALLSPLTILIMNLGILFLLYIGGVKVDSDRLQPGEILALISYMNQMLLALIVVSNLVVIFTKAAASASRVNEVLALTPQIRDVASPIQVASPLPAKDLIVFQEVDFRYSSTAGLALKQLSFTLQGNQMIGITGVTGSGKSTLTQLLPRFYDVSHGQVLIAGVDVKAWSLASLREKIRFVPQKAVLFSGTIRDNLQWGKPGASDTECWSALKTAQSADFIAALPAGLDTLVTEGGKNFSGGQRQRLTIARALIAQPDILVLDDSLSALDYQTDLALRRSLAEDTQSTVIIISQRIRSIKQAQQILVLDEGNLVGQGTHEELLQSNATYQALVASQEEE